MTAAGWSGILLYIKADFVRRPGTNPGEYIVFAPEHKSATPDGLVTSRTDSLEKEVVAISSLEESRE